MPSKVIVLKSFINFNQFTLDLSDNDPPAWRWVTKDAREKVESHNYFRAQYRTVRSMNTIKVWAVEGTDSEGEITKWAEREYRVTHVDLSAQIVEIVPATEWREFAYVPRAAVAPDPKKARA